MPRIVITWDVTRKRDSRLGGPIEERWILRRDGIDAAEFTDERLCRVVRELLDVHDNGKKGRRR